MSRVFTILVILALLAVVALVPQMGKEDPADHVAGPEEGYAYRQDTLARFALLLEDPAWSLTDPPRNAQGMLEAVHLKTGLTFVLIPPGSFMMGSPEEEEGRLDTEKLHPVAIQGPFLLCETECTQLAWERGGGTGCSNFKGAGRPVEYVTWTACHNWCAKNGLRLPSESEWEYACRAGSTDCWFFGDDESLLPRYGWGAWKFGPGTRPVGKKLPNPWGLFDVHGNVWEWCEDWRGEYSDAPSDGSPRTAQGDSKHRVNRGGAWSYSATRCRSAFRNAWPELWQMGNLGFRPAADLPN